MHSGNQIRDLRDTCRSNKALRYLDAPCAGGENWNYRILGEAGFYGGNYANIFLALTNDN